jgi:glutaredoxin-related protein
MSKKIKEAKVETESGKIITSQDQLKSFLKNNKDSHYNFEESIEYKISSGSLLLD